MRPQYLPVDRRQGPTNVGQKAVVSADRTRWCTFWAVEWEALAITSSGKEQKYLPPKLEVVKENETNI